MGLRQGRLRDCPSWTPDAAPMPYHCLMTQNAMFNSALESLPQFVMETDADWGMVYDFMESQCGELRDEHWEEVAEVYKEFMNDSRY